MVRMHFQESNDKATPGVLVGDATKFLRMKINRNLPLYCSYYLIIAFKGVDKTKPDTYETQDIKDKKFENMYITGKIGVGQMERFPAGDGMWYPTKEFKDNCNENTRRKRREGKTPETYSMV